MKNRVNLQSVPDSVDTERVSECHVVDGANRDI